MLEPPTSRVLTSLACVSAILVFGVGCAKRHPYEPPSDSEGEPPPPVEVTIVAGERIGPFTIGMTLDQVRATGLPGLVVDEVAKQVRLPAYELRLGDDLRVSSIRVSLEDAPPLFADGDAITAGTDLDRLADRFAPCDPVVSLIGGGGQTCRNGAITFGYEGPASNPSFLHRGQTTPPVTDVTVRAPATAGAAR